MIIDSKLAMMKAHADAMFAQPARPRPSLTEGTFSATSLMSWMDFANKAEVPSVGAELVAELDLLQLLKFEEDEHSAAMVKLFEINEALDMEHMLRWETCAPLWVKSGMSEGMSMREIPLEERFLHPGDPRAYDILFEFPKQTIGVYKRPIVDPMLVDSYPVEFRVFIADSKVAALSNYYPQMALPETSENIDYAHKALDYANQMLDQILATGQSVYNRNQPLETIHATLDFMVLKTGDLVFLEGGPGYGFNAHPCCFFDDKTKVVAPINGMMFAMGSEALPLPEANKPKATI